LGDILYLVGEGATRGTKSYRDRAGRLREFFVGEVLSMGQHFARLKVLGNEMVDVVLDWPPSWLRVGHVVLLKAPYCVGTKLKTPNVWPVKVTWKHPTRKTGTIYKVADLEREPVLFNSNLGHYTNFVNFFRLPALALPAGFRRDGLPFGITFVGHPNWDRMLLEFGARWQRAVPLPLGRTHSKLPEPAADPKVTEHRISIAVVGAHMSGLPLNGQLTELGGRLERAARTAPNYRLYALPGGPPQRPGLVRVVKDGAAVELEVWSLPKSALGHFVTGIPAPLGIGTIDLDDGSSAQGFLCENYATAGARDISAFGGWRAFLKSLS